MCLTTCSKVLALAQLFLLFFSSAYYTQYTQVAAILAKLKVPWIPIIGNHDTWIYNSTYNEPKPTGTPSAEISFFSASIRPNDQF